MSPMMQMGAMQPGMPQGAPMHPPQQPAPEQMAMLDKPSWEQVVGLLKDNVHRSYRIDIETDSTIAGSLESDMAGLSQVLQAVGSWMKESQPIVQSGMLPVDAAKEIAMTITRRARMGTAVEDALDKMQPPQPSGPDPALQVAQMKLQADQQKFQAEQQAEAQRMQMEQQMHDKDAQRDMQMEQAKLSMEMQARQYEAMLTQQTETHKQEMQAREEAQRNQLEAEREQMRIEADERMAQAQAVNDERMLSLEQQFQLLITQMNNAAKVEVAEIGKQGGLLQAEMTQAAREASDDKGVD